MVNREFEPGEREEKLLEVMKEHNRANPYLLREETGFGKGDVNTALTKLTSAGWVRKVTRGLYEFVEDPRETSKNSSDTAGDRITPDERVGDDAEKAREIQAKREQSRGEESENAERTHEADDSADVYDPTTEFEG